MGELQTRFGRIGAKGESGEIYLYQTLQKSYQVTDYRNDMIMQSQGIDFGIYKPEWRREYTLDVKNNFYIDNDYYSFKIEIEDNGKAGWFYTSKADRIYCTNAYLRKYIYYDLNEMRYYITKKFMDNDLSEFNVIKYQGYILVQCHWRKGQKHNFPISQVYW